MRRKSSYVAPADAAPKKTGVTLARDRRYDILGILLMVFAVLVFLAFISFTEKDEAVADIGALDFFRLFFGDAELKARADTTSNWLGLFGAMLARFFINSTIGYAAILFPLALGVWGWFILLNREKIRSLIYYTNFVLIAGFLFSTLAGLARLVDWLPAISAPWSGYIGDFMAGLLSRLIGTTGGFLLTLTAFFITVVIVIDLDVKAVAGKLNGLIQSFLQGFRKAPVDDNAEEAIAAVMEKPSRRARSGGDAIPDVVAAPREPMSDASKWEAKKRTLGFNGANGKDGKAAETLNADIPLDEVFVRSLTNPSSAQRSNGELAADSIPGLAKVLGVQPQTEAKAKPKPEIDSVTSSAKETSLQPEQAIDDAVNESRLAEREEKAVKAAAMSVTQTLLGLDHEDLNARLSKEKISYRPPTPELLNVITSRAKVDVRELELKKGLITEKLAVFGIDIVDVQATPGPVVTMFELFPESSVKISKIVALADDLALALAAKGIRIIAPIPGKSAVGVEIPNESPELVGFCEVIQATLRHKTKPMLPLAIGKAITGEVICEDLARMPHLLIAGATGSGKSVGINVMLNSLLYHLHPSDVKMVMIDPKKIELAQYRGLERHFLARCPDVDEMIITNPANAVLVLKSLELEMDGRYTKLAKAGVRHIHDYNLKIKSGEVKDTPEMRHFKLPYIIVVIDELADLMITAAREVEEPIARLAQLARAIGIHLVLATQRPSVDVITGVIKANFSSRIAFQVSSKIDSRTILDTNGAERLLGNGDMLYQPSGAPKPLRIQNAFLSTAEVERVVEFISTQEGYSQPYLLPSLKAAKNAQTRDDLDETDEYLVEAARLIVRHQQGSVSLLQRRLKIGYSRAARIVDQLELAGIVGPADGSKAREVLVEDELMVDQLLR